ncbi:MAG: ATP-binding protein [Ignavibacteria bacterium]|nr:ATP-binding protein [Ignavibacteria bacterium]
MIISIASGKGGTGKTTVACSLAATIENCTFLDCDVEEPNGNILLKPSIEKEEIVHKLIPEIDYTKCNFCNKCTEVCEYNALLNLKTEILLFSELCHSCGACKYFCPENAIEEVKKETGIIRKGKAGKNIKFFDGLLKLGEPAAAPLIKQVKKNADPDSINIIDSPPGTSCSMFEAVKDSDYCILVTESTPFGLNDLKLAADVLKEIGLPFGIVINKYEKAYTAIEEFADKNNIDILMKLPFRRDIAECYSRGVLPALVIPEYKEMITELFKKVKSRLKIFQY